VVAGKLPVLEVIADLQPVWANDPPFGVAERCMHAFYLDELTLLTA